MSDEAREKNADEILGFIDTQRTGRDADRVKTYAFETVMHHRRHGEASEFVPIPVPDSMPILYQMLYYSAFNKYDKDARQMILDGAPASSLIGDDASSYLSRAAVWCPPGWFYTLAELHDRGVKYMDVSRKDLMKSLPFYKPETREKVLTRSAKLLSNASGKDHAALNESFLSGLTQSELGIIVKERPAILALFPTEEPIPGLSGYAREQAWNLSGAAAGKVYASHSVLSAIKHDDDHMNELAHLIFSDEALSGAKTVMYGEEKRKTRYRLMSHLSDGKKWWKRFDMALEGDIGWNRIRYERVRGGTNTAPGPFLSEVLNRSIEAGVFNIPE